jgi:enoyl-coA hydratase, R-specific
MNHYTFEDLYVGMKESFTVEITEDMQRSFTNMSGDVNPMHLDRNECLAGGYRDCLVYGMCTASFYSTLVGVYLPGEKCLFHRCEVEWPAPVYIGDTLTVTGTVKEVDSQFRRIVIKAEMRNQDKVKVSRAKLTVGVRE